MYHVQTGLLFWFHFHIIYFIHAYELLPNDTMAEMGRLQRSVKQCIKI